MVPNRTMHAEARKTAMKNIDNIVKAKLKRAPVAAIASPQDEPSAEDLVKTLEMEGYTITVGE